MAEGDPFPIDDPWSNNPPKKQLTLPTLPKVPGADPAPLTSRSLQEAWSAYLRARRDHLEAMSHRALVRAQLSTAFRAEQRATVDMVQAYYLRHPAYVAAAEAARLADELYTRATAELEIARAEAGIAVSAQMEAE